MDSLSASRLLILGILLFSNYIIADDFGGVNPPAQDDGGISELERSIPKDYLSDFPNEYIPVQSMNVEYNYDDVSIPGPNGLDLLVKRKFIKGAFSKLVGFGLRSWHLPLPTISTTKHASGVPSSINLGCLTNITSVSINNGDGTLRSVGYSSSSNTPANTLAALSDRSVLTCENGFPVLTQTNGVKLTFSEIKTSTNFGNVNKDYFLKKIEDRFNNSLTYHYGTENSTLARKKLLKITRSDGYEVNFNYEKVGLYEQISSIVYENRTINYDYNSSKQLITHTDPAGRETKYEYAALDYLESVTTPEELKVVYTYYPLELPAFNEGKLSGKTVSGPGIATRSFHHEFPSVYAGKRAIQIEHDVLPGVERVKEFIIKKIATVNSSAFANGDVVLSGRITSKSIYQGTRVNGPSNRYLNYKLLISETRNWGKVINGTSDCAYRIGTTKDDRRTCATPLLLSKVIKVNNDGVFDSFTTVYSNHDEFGNSQLVHEYNNFSSHNRYTKLSFVNNYQNWVIGQLNKKELSDDNANWKTELDYDYYSWSTGGGYKSQIKYVKRFGVINRTFSNYRTTGELTTAKDADNHSYTYSNYEFGIPKSIQIPGVTTAESIKLDNFGNATEATDFEGNKTEYIYDHVNRLKEIKFPKEAGNVFWHEGVYEYSKVDVDDLAIAGGVLVDGQHKTIYQNGTFKKSTYYDALSRVVLIEEKDLSSPDSVRYVRMEYDIDNNVVFTSYKSAFADDAAGIRNTFDELGRITSMTNNSGTTNIRYLSQNRKRVTDPRSYQTTYTYQAFGKPSKRFVTKIAAPEGVTTDIVRNVLGNKTHISQKGYFNSTYVNNSRSFTYDNREFLCRVYNPETGYTAYRYDNDGKLTWEMVGMSTNYCNNSTSRPSSATEYSYDSLGNLTLVDNPSGTTDFTYKYDDNGNQTESNRGSIKWTYEYNSLQSLTKESLSVDGYTFDIDYGFDGRGNHSTTTLPSGRRLDFLPNAFGQPTRANNYVHSAKYHPNGEVQEFTYGNGKKFTLTLNDDQLPERYLVPGVTDLTYYYGDSNNISSIVDGLNSSENRSMAYDGLNRLVTATGPWGSGSFQYDPVGNLMSKSLGNKNYNFVYNRAKNTLTSVTGSKAYSFEYDSRGNVKNNGSYSFVYDKADLLMNVNNGSTASYTYDANKKRVKKTEGGNVTYTVYSKSGDLLHKFNVNSNKVSDFVNLGKTQVAKVDGPPGGQAPPSPAYVTVPGYSSNGSYTVSWPTTISANSYTMQEKTNSGSWVTRYSGTGLTKYLTGRTEDSYQYRVRACNSNGCSQYRESEVLGNSSTPSTPTVPNSPSAPTAPATDNDGVFSVSWNSVGSADTYELQQKFNSNAYVTIRNTSSLVHLVNTIAGTHKYRVRACNADGCSAYSPEATTNVVIFGGGGGVCRPGQPCQIEP